MTGRLTYFALIALTALVLPGCATRLQTAPTFDQPSTTAIRTSLTVVHASHVKAQEAVKTTAHDLDTILDACPQAKAIIVQAQLALTQASTAVADAEAATAQAEGARDQLDTQLKQTTDKANALARNFLQSQSQITALQQSRHSWVKRFWMAAGMLTLAAVWIFRKPIMLMAGGIGI